MNAEKILEVLFDLIEDQEKVNITFTTEQVVKDDG